MSILSDLRFRMRALFQRRAVDEELADELRFHFENEVEKLRRAGLTEEEARRQARLAFGGQSQVAEDCREARGATLLDSVLRDVRYALRQMKRSPGFTVTVVMTLALGIGVNATMFSLVSAFLMPRLPGHDPQDMVVVSTINPNQSDHADVYAVSAPSYLVWRADTRVFAEMAADSGQTGSLVVKKQPEAIEYAAVSPNYFGVFGVHPLIGRTFLPGEDAAGRNHVVILSYGLWKSRFAADPSIVGGTVLLNRENYAVIGVMPADFRLLGYTPQLWTPLALTAADAAPAARRDRDLFLFARLAPGVTLDQARSEMQALAIQAQHDFPDTEKRWGASVRRLPDYLVYEFDIRNSLYVLMTMVGLVLLIACVNVAGLLLTRGAGRQKEMAIRVSLGASRVRVIRQLLTEGLVLALGGGAAGLLLTVFGIRLLRSALTFNVAMSSVPVTIDDRVLWFALGISVASAILSSIGPAWNASHTHIDADLRSEGRTSSAGRAHSRLRAVLVGSEIAMALFLLMGSSLLVYGLYRLDHQRLGFRQDHLLTAGVILDQKRYGGPSQQLHFVRDLLPRLEQIPGVEDAAVASDLPSSGGSNASIQIQGEPASPNGSQRHAVDVQITPDFFRVAGISLLRGRTFNDADDAKAPPVVLVNEEFVHRYLGGYDAVGTRIQVGSPGKDSKRSEVVGVVGNVKYYSARTEVDPEIYQPLLQHPVASFSLMLRSSVEPDSLLPDLRRTVAALDPELPLLRTMSMRGVIRIQRNGDPLFSEMLGAFALLALILAAIGIYGLIAYSVTQRMHEIGIRLALGASGPDISWMILRHGLKIAAIGSFIGMAMAVPLPRLLNAMFEGFDLSSPGLFPTVLAATLAIATVSSWIPARRASRVDPTAALRDE